MAMARFSVGKSAHKKSKFKLSHDVNTTSSFGFMQPCLSLEMLPQSKAVVNWSNFTRMMPMVSPTFGRVQLRLYHQFVDMREICPQYDFITSKLPYRTNQGSYTPTEVPNIPINELSRFVLSLSSCSVYDKSNTTLTLETNGTTAQNKINFVCQDLGLRTGINPTIEDDPTTAVTLDGADYVCEVNNTVLAFRFSDAAKNLRKILLGLGYVINITLTDKVSLLPLFAYYKAYFDIFAIKRTLNWENTNLYKFIDYIYQYNVPSFSSWNNDNIVIFNQFIENTLVNDCYYVDDNDFISVHQLTPSLSPSQSINVGDPESLSMTIGSSVNNNSLPYQGGGSFLSQARLDALKVLTVLSNKRSIFGKVLSKYLRDEYNENVDDHWNSKNIGQFAVNLNISDVMASAQTDEKDLGDYAGKGYGSNQNETYSFEANQWGYWISMFTVVPISGYVQGLNQNLTHINYDTIYHPEFDSLGYQLTPKSLVYSNLDVVKASSSSASGSFGFVPRYFEMKTNCSQNVLSGDLSCRSTRDSMLPFTLDKFISATHVKGLRNETTGNYTGYSIDQNSIPSDPSAYRILGRYQFMQNYDRIFQQYDSQVIGEMLNKTFTTDPFVCHNVVDIDYYAPMIPINESYDVESMKDNAQNVDKA